MPSGAARVGAKEQRLFLELWGSGAKQTPPTFALLAILRTDFSSAMLPTVPAPQAQGFSHCTPPCQH